MMPNEFAAGRPQNGSYRRPLRLLIGTACATWIDLAQGQIDGRLIDLLPSPMLLCSAPSLFTSIVPISVRVPKATSVPEISGLHMRHDLSFVNTATMQSGGRPDAPVQVMAAATRIEEPDEPVPLEEVRPGPSNTVSNSAAPMPQNLPDLSAAGWALAPIRWGGNLSSNYNLNESSGGGKTFSETQIMSLRGSSYIYQPWYAQVSADLGLLTGSSRQSGGDSSESSSGRSTSVAYGGNLSLFPQSRFPFQAYAQSSDSRADANAQGSQYTSVRMGARQSYRPEVGPENYSASVDRSVVTTANVRSVVDALQGTYATTIADHGLSANGRFSRNIGDVGGQGSNLLSLNGTHSWRANEEINVTSSANYMNNQIRMLTGTGLSLNNSEVMQAQSSVTWLPSEDLPLTIVGGGSFLRLNTETETAKANLTNLNGYVNAIYRFSRNLTTTAGLTLAQNQSDGISQFSSGQNASVSYSGNPLIIGDYSYNWGAGTGVSNQVVSSGAANRNLSAQVQHSLLRNIALNETNAITLNASQSYARADNSTSGQSGILTHAGGGSWRLGIGERSLGMLSATFSDSIATGNFPGHLRSLSAQGNIQTQLSGRASLTANLNVVFSQQLSNPELTQTATPDTPDSTTNNNSGSTLNGSAQVSYAHRNPFGIANLIYTATFQANASQTNLRLISGDPDALAWQTGQVFRQNADYRLGRLSFRATSTFARLNGKNNASVFLMLGREIGDF